MSQENARDVLKLLMGLERLAKLAEAVPEDLLAAWLHYDAGLSKTQSREVAKSIRRLIEVLSRREEE